MDSKQTSYVKKELLIAAKIQKSEGNALQTRDRVLLLEQHALQLLQKIRENIARTRSFTHVFDLSEPLHKWQEKSLNINSRLEKAEKLCTEAIALNRECVSWEEKLF
jgi:hypothetical protein